MPKIMPRTLAITLAIAGLTLVAVGVAYDSADLHRSATIVWALVPSIVALMVATLLMDEARSIFDDGSEESAGPPRWYQTNYTWPPITDTYETGDIIKSENTPSDTIS